METKDRSLTFLDFARLTLVESVTDKTNKEFLLKEATNFEILHLLAFEKFPKNRQSKIGESIIISFLGDYVSENRETFETFIGPTTVSSFISEAENQTLPKIRALISGIKEKGAKAGEKISKHPILGAGALAVAALAGYAAYKLYQNYFSKVSRSCSGSPDKVSCVKKARVSALKAQATVLKSSMSSCRKTNNPEKCRASISKKISGVEARISNLLK